MSAKTGLKAADIKDDELYGLLLRAQGEDHDYSDLKIEDRISAAEAFYETNLQIFFGKHQIIGGAHERGIAVDPDAEVPQIEEPGYDYDQALFSGERWGNFLLRYRPVIPDPSSDSGITRVVFSFPSAKSVLYEVPQPWIKPDFKYAQINLIPATGAIYASFNLFILSVISGGAYGLPKIVFIDYFAGYDPARLRRDHSDLLLGIKMRTVLFMGGILGDIRTQQLQSSSISLDGLSHSRGFAGGRFGPLSGRIEQYLIQEKEIRESFRSAVKGPVFCVL